MLGGVKRCSLSEREFVCRFACRRLAWSIDSPVILVHSSIPKLKRGETG